jgi:hypothetical protein
MSGGPTDKDKSGRAYPRPLNEIVSDLRSFAVDHSPDGWPAVRMREITELCDAVDLMLSSFSCPECGAHVECSYVRKHVVR